MGENVEYLTDLRNKIPYLRAVSTYIDLIKSLNSPAADQSIAQLYLYRIGVEPHMLVETSGRNPLSGSDFISKKKYLNQHTQTFKHFINTCIICNIETHIKTLLTYIIHVMDSQKNDKTIDPKDRTRFIQTHKSSDKYPITDSSVRNISTISPSTQRYMQEVIKTYSLDTSDNGLFMNLKTRDHLHGSTYQRVSEIAQMTKADSYARHQRDEIPFDTIFQYFKIFTDNKNNPTHLASSKSDYGVVWTYQQNLEILEAAFFIVCMLNNISASQLFPNDHFEQIEDKNLNISDTAIAVLPSVEKSLLRAFQNTDGHRMTHLAVMYIKYMRQAENSRHFITTKEPRRYHLEQ